ncbi:hypothetical protein PFISCL1PPCAC_12876, partial [Pristionchus fissidentatus]
AAGFIMNVVLLYAIRRFTKKSLGTYKHLLTIFAAYDTYLVLLHAVLKPKVVIKPPTFGVVSDDVLESRRATSFFCACFTVPFTLMNIHFVYRFWSVSRPHLIPIFSEKKFILFLCSTSVGGLVIWYLLCVYCLTGEIDEVGTVILREAYDERYGKIIDDGWIVMDWVSIVVFNPRVFFAMVCFDIIMAGSFTLAATLACFTFYHIKTTQTFSAQAHSLQLKLFIAVCAQTFVPLVFVYIPYACAINFPFFGIPIFLVDDLCMTLTACFPAWDAVIMIGLMKDYRQAF